MPQKIAELPEISWEKYTNNADFSHFASARHKTRHKKGPFESGNSKFYKLINTNLLHFKLTNLSFTFCIQAENLSSNYRHLRGLTRS